MKLDRHVVSPQTAAPKLVVMKQLDLSKLLRGQFKLFSVEKLVRMLTAFDFGCGNHGKAASKTR